MTLMRYQPQNSSRLSSKFNLPQAQCLNAGAGLQGFNFSRLNVAYTGQRILPTISGLGVRLYSDHDGNVDDVIQANLDVSTAKAAKFTTVITFVPRKYSSTQPQQWFGPIVTTGVGSTGHTLSISETTNALVLGYDGGNGFARTGSYTPSISPWDRKITVVISSDPVAKTLEIAVDGEIVTASTGLASYIGSGNIPSTSKPTLGNGAYTNFYGPNGSVLLWATIPNLKLTSEQARLISLNPWQIMEGQEEEFEVVSGNTIVSTSGSSSSTSTATGEAFSIFQSTGSSSSTSTINSDIRAIFQSSGSSAGSSSLLTVARVIWNSSGNVSVNSLTSATTNALWNTIGLSSSSSIVNASTNTIWAVVATGSGTSSANANTGSTNTVSTDGSSSGVSSASGLAAAIVETLGTISGVANVSAETNVIISTNGNSQGHSTSFGNAIAIKITLAESSGSSVVDAVTGAIKAVVANASGFSTANAEGDGGVPPEELEPISGNVSVMLLTPVFAVAGISDKYFVSKL